MEEKNVYGKLADHLANLGMGYPVRDSLVEILEEILDPEEAKIALALPSGVIPLSVVSIDDIASRIEIPRGELESSLERLAEKGFLYVGKTPSGERGYALLHLGFGFPQTFFWKGEDTPHARKMALLTAKYFNRQVLQESYGATPKAYRYIPVGKSVKADLQAVFPVQLMEDVISKAERIAVAHCPCRIMFGMVGKGCDHPTEVCMKFDELAEFLIERGLAREVSKKEAVELIRISEEAGLVHFVDNAEGNVKHNCNCCGCACWNVGNIRRRKLPRDAIMATYFMRDTLTEECIGCGKCAAICPVDAVRMTDNIPVIETEYCIGCGVCAGVCPADAVFLKAREDKTGERPAADFRELHLKILDTKKAGK